MRAGVDDRDMVSALGINVQLVFAGAFFLGAMLAGYGGVLGGTMISLQPGEDTSFLLNSLIVVIIGGMGSLGGAAIGALALGLVDAYADVYLIFGDTDLTNYSILRHVRAAGRRARRAPARPVREAGVSLDAVDAAAAEAAPARDSASLGRLDRARACSALALDRSTTSSSRMILTKALWLGARRGEPDLPVGLRRHGVARPGRRSTASPGMTYANLVAADGGNPAAWSPWLAAIGALVVATAVGLAVRLRSPSRSEGIYFLMLTLAFSVLVYYFFSQVTQLSGFGGVNNLDLPGLIGDPGHGPGAALLRRAGRLRASCSLCMRYVSRTPFGLALQGLRDEPARMRALGLQRARCTARSRSRFAAFIAAFAGHPGGLVQPPHLAGVDQPRRRRSTS